MQKSVMSRYFLGCWPVVSSGYEVSCSVTQNINFVRLKQETSRSKCEHSTRVCTYKLASYQKGVYIYFVTLNSRTFESMGL